MPTWLKIIMAIFLAFIVLAGVGVWLGYRWFQQNKGQLREQGQKTMEEGSAYGTGKTVAECLDESMRRLDRDTGFMGEVRTRVFFTACAQAAASSPELCTGVPRSTEIMKSVQWTADECRRRGKPDHQPCMRLMREVIQRCEKSEPSR